MFRILLFLSVFCFQSTFSQVLLDADGPGDTYALITSVLAPGQNPIETPDCSHSTFGDHIDEVYDNDLEDNVFRFYMHTTPDDDRCINFDRQRNEIKTYDQSPDNLLGVEDETVIYKWKFKLDDGFQASSSFTHLHQLKSVGGPLAGMPIYTLTARKSSPDRLELRYAQTDSQVTLTQVDLAPFIGTWVEVTETIKYGTSGTYAITINRVDTGGNLLTYSNNSIINWRLDADFVRPKWGIYRSLNNVQDLRDETVLFANFSIEEIDNLGLTESEIDDNSLLIIPNPASNNVNLKNISNKITLIELFSIDGRKVLSKVMDSETETNLDISRLTEGTYLVNLSGNKINQSKLMVVSRQ